VACHGSDGKWHLGRADEDHPNAHGFAEFYGFVGGLNAYLPKSPDPFVAKILRNREPAQETAYLTDAFGREAAAFLERHAREPFFLVVAFNAPHGPLQAPESLLARFASVTPPARRTYAAAVASMDDAIGVVLAKLRALELDEKTLVFFLNDNGGPLSKRGWNGSSNGALRGQKGMVTRAASACPSSPAGRASCRRGASTMRPERADLAPTAPRSPASRSSRVGPRRKDILPHLAGRTSTRPTTPSALDFAPRFRSNSRGGPLAT
jgi:arylsulfatase A-like enzyme